MAQQINNMTCRVDFAVKYNEMKQVCKDCDKKISNIKDNYKGTRVTAHRHLAQMENIARRYKKGKDEEWRFYERYSVLMDYLTKERVI